MRIRSIIITLFILPVLGLITVPQLPKHSVQIFFGHLLAESGSHSRSTKLYGNLPQHQLDIYRPDNGQDTGATPDKKPIILFLYGGGWREGAREIYEFVGAALTKRGYTTIIPDYRVYPEVSFPKFIEDAALAYFWVWKNIARSGANSRPIIVMGHSAGAHSAAMIALNPAYLAKYADAPPPPTALIGISGPYAFDPTTWPTTKDIFATAPTPDAARPSAHVGSEAPPALLLHGLKDTTVRMFNLETLQANYRKAGRKVVVKTYPNMSHIDIVLTIARPLRWRASVLKDITDFIQNLPPQIQPPHEQTTAGALRKTIDATMEAFIKAAKLAGHSINKTMIDIEFLPAPHKPSALPKNKMAVYGFWGDGAWLKIGKAGPKSNARYQSQHYNLGSTRSTLARSLVEDTHMSSVTGFDRDSPGTWIKRSTHRINILLPSDQPKELLSFLETFLHLDLRPRYEH